MQQKKLGLSLTLVGMVLLFVSSMAYADLYWESEQVTKSVPNQPTGTRVQKYYYTLHASRIDMGDGNVMIMHFDTGNIYRLNTKDKTYTQMNMNDMGGPPGMTRDMKMQGFQVTPSNETKTISGYSCKKYHVNFMMVKSDYWLSKDVEGYQELKAIGAKLEKQFEKNPMMKQMNMVGMMDKLDGFPVQTVAHMMGGTIVTTLTTIEHKSLSKDLFEVPGDYTLQEAR